MLGAEGLLVSVERFSTDPNLHSLTKAFHNYEHQQDDTFLVESSLGFATADLHCFRL
jgi:hypothetical protein